MSRCESLRLKRGGPKEVLLISVLAFAEGLTLVSDP